ncbi:MAG: cation:proton antiporter [Chloroflexi bacterium]|nr:cation:proton antiporter [Chloroflexota bacterium]
MKGTTEVLLLLLLDLAIIIVAARTFGALARRMGQPGVIGEIVAGILLGPTVLGRLFPGLPAELFPKEVPLRQLADLGLVFFMFLVGLELDPRLIRKEGRRALSISLSGVLAPFALGALIGIPLLSLNNGGVFAEGVTQPPSGLAFSLFMGAAMCITAFPVLARILVERGLYKSPLGTSVLCAAAVDDVTAWILLAAVVGLTRTGSAVEALSAFILTAIFAAFMLTAGRRLLALLSKRYEATGHLTVDQVAAVVVGLLLSAYATEWIGIHSIFGAFIFGTIMPHESRMTHELTDKIEDFTVVVLLPVFFTVAGLRTNLFAINSPELVLWLLLIVGAAIGGKLAGCGLAAKLNGYSARDSFVVGTLMNTRGLTELVILTIGLSLGVLSDRTFAMMVIMALVTTFMAAPIINRIMSRREMVRVLAGGDVEPGVRRVLVALGNPDNADALVDAGIRLTGGQRPAELLLVRLIATPRAREYRSGLRNEESQLDLSVDAMRRLERQVAAKGVTARSVSFLSDDVGQDLAHVAATQRCDVMVVGWHRASLERQVVRYLVHRIFELAPCDVVVFVDAQGRGIQPGDDRPVLAALVTQLDAEGVMRIAQPLARCLDTRLLLLSYLADAPSSAEPGAADRLAAATERSGLSSDVTVESVSVNGNGIDVVVQTSSRAAVAVVAVGPALTADAAFGQPATAVADRAECPVLVVRPAGTTMPWQQDANRETAGASAGV